MQRGKMPPNLPVLMPEEALVAVLRSSKNLKKNKSYFEISMKCLSLVLLHSKTYRKRPLPMCFESEVEKSTHWKRVSVAIKKVLQLERSHKACRKV